MTPIYVHRCPHYIGSCMRMINRCGCGFMWRCASCGLDENCVHAGPRSKCCYGPGYVYVPASHEDQWLVKPP